MSSSVVTCEQIENAIRNHIETSLDALIVKDLSDGCGAKFEIVVVTAQFDSMALLDRQRLVHAALGDLMSRIHAVTLRTWKPAQWQTKKSAYHVDSDAHKCEGNH
jgi:acid stress-induced BolA-like protein IbaG/YrbA